MIWQNCDHTWRAQVCLSLLGTWHGTDETQKWHPDTANLWRVLVSIQGMILIGDPYFNEPNVRSCLPLVHHPHTNQARLPQAAAASTGLLGRKHSRRCVRRALHTVQHATRGC